MLAEGFDVVGIDALTDYYHVRLKESRHAMLEQSSHFKAHIVNTEDFAAISVIFEDVKPEPVAHLALQAGVRYSLENPRAYFDTNISGTFNVMECARAFEVSHLLMALTWSAYGANEAMPFAKTEKADTPLCLFVEPAGDYVPLFHRLWSLRPPQYGLVQIH